MPAVIDPTETYRITLERDGHKPDGERLSLEFHHMTAREFQALAAAATEGDGTSADIDSLIKNIGQTLVGWHNAYDRGGAKITFDTANLADVLTVNDLFEVYAKMCASVTPGGDDLGKSESQRPSNTGKSASGADPGAVSTAQAS